MEYKRCSSCIPGLGVLTGYYQHGQLSPGDIYKNLISSSSPSDLDTVIEKLHTSISDACTDNPTQLPNKPSHPAPATWWSPFLQQLKRETKKLCRLYKSLNPPPNRDQAHKDFLHMRAWFYRECKKAKRREFRMFSGSFVNDPWGSLHKFIKKGSQNPNPLSSTSFEKNLLSHSVPKYLNSILNTFFSNPPPDTRPAHFHYSTPRHHPISHPDPPFTSVELRIACSSLKPRKAPGPDHIPGKFAKWMVSSFHDFFLLLYNSCLTLGHFPTAWKIGRLALIPKPHSDGDFTSSHRPITLLSAFSKIFESLLCHRLSHLLENNNLLNPLQFGFRRGVSPTDALFNLKTQISNAITSHQCCLLINLDIKSAFDHLCHPALISRLSNIGLSPSYISIYSSFLNNRQVTLQYRGFSCTTSPKRGCAQGSKSGPILWNIFFGPILSLPFPPGVHAQAFADDLQLVIHGDPNNF
ncbi:hypothetical protein LAZ67_1003654 [Cordylochernes scorpioides]|uniref:Reverse transcriptase domain-containing protein n=1 Tax=Cordylochernes scorpioides TaxID=51811 RepID=A0ABY6JZZ4_9ARAC|nr:hypothetical protein LAZ67_1003654 [Cordylochernes scorpioides]